jgi:hypothetical protein
MICSLDKQIQDKTKEIEALPRQLQVFQFQKPKMTFSDIEHDEEKIFTIIVFLFYMKIKCADIITMKS